MSMESIYIYIFGGRMETPASGGVKDPPATDEPGGRVPILHVKERIISWNIYLYEIMSY